VIDRQELRALLESTAGGSEYSLTHWLTDEDLERVMRQYDTDKNGVISFDEFVVLVRPQSPTDLT
jgi:Ca2+-binding EF-hand superfamily protein